jgi:hypothetical protein
MSIGRSVEAFEVGERGCEVGGEETEEGRGSQDGERWCWIACSRMTASS